MLAINGNFLRRLINRENKTKTIENFTKFLAKLYRHDDDENSFEKQ